MSTFLLKVCAAERCSSTLFNEYRHLTQAHTKALLARAAAASARLRRPRADRAPASPLRKRRRQHGCHSLHRLLQRRIDTMVSNQQIRRRSSAADRNPLGPSIASSAATTTIFASTSASDSVSRNSTEDMAGGSELRAGGEMDSTAMPPPPPPSGRDISPTRQSRSTSSASRNANRLSLTLPIAPPSSDPSRPTPTYAATPSSICPTPVESSGQVTPADGNEFIIAIAAQERRVLELKEELVRAEAELVVLKKQWTQQGGYSKKSSDSRQVETPRRNTPGGDDDSSVSSRQSVDLDRRKSLLLQTQGTPSQSRRKVLRGGHTRTLSLLSPQKSESGFAIHEDKEADTIKLPPVDRRAAQLTNTTLNKRASWQPQSNTYQASVPGFVEDFRVGLKAFVEDIRQITVGDEPIMGSANRSQAQAGDSPANRNSSGDHDTIRPSHSARPKVSNVFDSPGSDVSTPSKGRSSIEKAKARKNKHFSWTPLSFDSLDDDNGWTSWESPASTKSTRWSGSTVNNAGVEDIASIPEAREDAIEQS